VEETQPKVSISFSVYNDEKYLSGALNLPLGRDFGKEKHGTRGISTRELEKLIYPIAVMRNREGDCFAVKQHIVGDQIRGRGPGFVRPERGSHSELDKTDTLDDCACFNCSMRELLPAKRPEITTGRYMLRNWRPH